MANIDFDVITNFEMWMTNLHCPVNPEKEEIAFGMMTKHVLQWEN